MKKFILSIFTLILIQGCNDGDLIVTNFDFEAAQLQQCGETGSLVFFKINPQVNESISLYIPTSEELFLETGTQSFSLSTSGSLVNYRSFNDAVTANYFCNPIPPTSPLVAIEYTGTSGVARLISETTRDDTDGVAFVASELLTDEGFGDFDDDGIPNYYDFDDDGDNVLTSLEIGEDPENPRDSDLDGMPDYLDTDDDNDGVLTINEDINQNLNPADDISEAGAVANYLDAMKTDMVAINAYRAHTYNRTSNGTIIIDNLVLISAEEEIIIETFTLGAIEAVRNETIIETPDF
jgi:hypothetical protein